MPSAYEQLLDRLRRLHALGRAAGHLAWDQETMMPSRGVEPRAEELSTISAISHETFTSEQTGRLLAQAEKEASDDKQRAMLREVRWEYDRATKVPTELVEALSRATSRALPVWANARKEGNYGAFQPILNEIVDLKRRYAHAVDPDKPAYEVLFQDYEPWIPLQQTRDNLAALRKGLQPLIEKAAKQPRPENPFTGEWPVDQQVRFNQEVLVQLGYDLERGRLDVSAHPFSTGNRYDARITTRYDPHDPLSGIGSTIHEFGHSLYTLGLPEQDFGTPLGDARDLVVHESQSRLWENHVGRSLPFWEWVLPRVQKSFPGKMAGVTPEQAWRASNVVEPSLVRVEADELTYHMHIALRFEVEESLFSGRVTVDEIPHVWNERMESYLGVRPDGDGQGCLQDVHWSHGMFGYFPTYSLGSMLAAQVFDTFRRETPDVAEQFRNGRFGDLGAWLRERVHSHGKRYKTGELIERATGRALSPDAFLAYAEEKFERVWKAA